MEPSRRDILKGLLAGAASLSLGGAIGCDERDTSNKPTLQDTLMEDSTKLKEFPYMMSKDGQFNGYIIVGDNAPGSDVLAGMDIVAGIGGIPITIPADTSKLASEIGELDKHAIVIGRDYDNPLIRYDEVPSLVSGEGYLGLEKENGLYRLIVSGFESLDIRKAGRVLAEHCSDTTKYDLNGKKILVTGTSLTDLATKVLE